jgi:hypothetical protein
VRLIVVILASSVAAIHAPAVTVAQAELLAAQVVKKYDPHPKFDRFFLPNDHHGKDFYYFVEIGPNRGYPPTFANIAVNKWTGDVWNLSIYGQPCTLFLKSKVHHGSEKREKPDPDCH